MYTVTKVSSGEHRLGHEEMATRQQYICFVHDGYCSCALCSMYTLPCVKDLEITVCFMYGAQCFTEMAV